ncbi:Zinc finger, RanBP2-type [Dillenia turbinata]|uniref:Zinc finger, RanBP2-type n=1 Tax=Dillenia turbinata TaxID=194707 RepID=A0AAN8Z5S1_9MAGN
MKKKLLAITCGFTMSNLRTQFTNPRFLSITPYLQCVTRLGVTLDESENLQSLNSTKLPEVHITHPWPEWVELMQLLLAKGYFGGSGGNPFQKQDLGSKDLNSIRTACLNFARDQSDLIRFLSRKDIHVVSGSGCPSMDRKVVNSGKRLRAHVGVDEGNVCGSCNLRGNCDRAYVKAREDESGRTVDIMRILLTYGLDPISGLVENTSCLNKTTKESVRRLLKEMVKLSINGVNFNPHQSTSPSDSILSAQKCSTSFGKGQSTAPVKPGDWRCPKCNFLNFARNIKCLRCNGLFQERLQKLGEDQNLLPLKKGDWLCGKCNFLNFAKNSRCFQCEEKPPKRHLNPGEWECESCNYINFRKNMICLKCNHRRPKASKHVTTCEIQHESGTAHSYEEGSKDKSYIGRKRLSDKQGSDRWNFVEDANKDCENENSKILSFIDFPIAGGRSELSKDAQKRGAWKLEMSQRTSNSVVRETAGDFQSVFLQRKLELLDLTDDEEMAEWFGAGKKEKERDKNMPARALDDGFYL